MSNAHLPTSGDQIEESYWNSLLADGEYTRTVERDAVDVHSAIPTRSFSQTPQSSEDWQEAQHIMADDSVLSLAVVGHNRGGLLVEWRSIRGFVPASQLVDFSSTDSAAARNLMLDSKIGMPLILRIIELDAAQNRLILSERAAQVENGVRGKLLHQIRKGDTLSGRVTNLVDFGAFVDLGGVEGLIHISELSWGRVGHPADILQRGQPVQVHVLDVDPAATRIALSIKRLRADPWATVDERYKMGEIIEGSISNVVDFGAFACIEEGLEGLIHFSELAEGHFLHPRNVVKEGDVIRARILSIDGKARRLGLTLRLT